MARDSLWHPITFQPQVLRLGGGTHLAKRARAKANLILQPPENSLMTTDSH